MVKSSTPSALAKAGSGSSVIATPMRADAGELAGILAEMRRARPLDGAGDAGAVNGVDGADQRLAHAAGGADDDQAHVAHDVLLAATACALARFGF